MRYYHVPEDYNEVISYEFNEWTTVSFVLVYTYI